MEEAQPFERRELQELRDRCEALAAIDGTNQTWVRAFLALASAADHLEAMLARSAIDA